MIAMHEHSVSLMAHRLGLQVVVTNEAGAERLYRLIETESMTPIYPGGLADGAALHELEDWLGLPWD